MSIGIGLGNTMAYHFRTRPPRLRMDHSGRPNEYTSTDSTDSDDAARAHAIPTASPRNHSLFLFPPSARASRSSTPVPSRSTSPLPQFYPTTLASSSCPSDSDSDEEPTEPLFRDRVGRDRDPLWRERRRPWWTVSNRRRPKQGGWIVRGARRWLRGLVRHPLFPSQPITIVSRLDGLVCPTSN